MFSELQKKIFAVLLAVVVVCVVITMVLLIIQINDKRSSEHMTEDERRVQVLRGLQGMEHMTEDERRAQVLRGLQGMEHMTDDERRAQVLRGLQGSQEAEHFKNPNRVLYPDLPMLGGGDMTLAAMAMRAADPIESPTIEQFKKENELLAYLLNN